MKDIIIAPSILAAHFDNIGSLMKKLEEDGIKLLHYDVMDGHFVPNISFGPKFIRECMGLTSIPADIHLMIEEPEKLVEDFIALKPEIILVQYEAVMFHRRLFSTFGKIKRGLALNPSTPLELIFDILDTVDHILIMSVDPGFYGQKMMKGSLTKVEKLKSFITKNGLDIKIQMDGGINSDNLKDVKNAGVDIAIVGAGYFE